MVINFKVILKKIKKMEKGFSHGLTVISTKDFF